MCLSLICCLQEIQFRSRDTKRGGKIYLCNWNQKKAGIAILISDKIDFKIKIVIIDKGGHYKMIKGSL